MYAKVIKTFSTSIEIIKRNYPGLRQETLGGTFEIPDYSEIDAFFNFLDGLSMWARMEIERRGAKDLSTAMPIAESLIELYWERLRPPKEKNGNGNGGGDDDHMENKFGH